MNILQLSIKFPWPPNDGGALATLVLTRGFSELGHEVTMLAMNTSKHFFEMERLPEPVKKMADFRTVPVNTGIRFHKALLNLFFSRMPYNAERFVVPAFSEKLRFLLGEKKFDIIQLEGLYLMPYLPVIRSCTSTPVVLRAHNVESEIWLRKFHQEQSLLKKAYTGILASRLRRMEIASVNQYDLLVTITERDADFFEKYGNEKPLEIIPFGIDPADYPEPVFQTDSPSLFYIGALDWQPNISGLLWFLEEVWAEVKREFPHLAFHIAGRNAAPELQKRIHRHPVVFHGEVPSSRDFMRDKNILVVPLFAGSGIRVKIIEAMAMGKTVISTELGTEGIPASEDKELFHAQTAEDFIDAIRTLAARPSRIAETGLAARQLVFSRFNNRDLTRKLLAFYKSHTA